MNQWTDSAKARLEHYCSRMREQLASSGVDVEEVTEDVKRHVEAEIAQRKLGVVTEQDVGQILAGFGGPDPALSREEPQPSPRANHQPPSPPPAFSRGGWLFFLGVVVPVIAIGVEFFTGSCAATFFDPLPTFWHVLLTASVPVINLAVWLALRQDDLSRHQALGWANGLAIGVALVYALLFLPLSPFALIGVLFYGFGLIPLGPLLALIGAVWLRKRLRGRLTPRLRLPNVWLGASIGVLLLGLASLSTVLTQIGLQKAMSEQPDESTQGIRWLRTWGQEEELLRACYGRAGRAGQLYSWGKPIYPEAARTIYYRVYGQPFNSVPPPTLYSNRARWGLVEEEFTWDNDQGGDAVAGRVRGVSIQSSRQDGWVDPAAGLGYLEWTMEFKNVSARQREARAQVLLPPGAVISRLTLWIDGEEREAAFGGRSQVKTAYKQVVQQRRDPVLVTTCGPDRVLVQCFPLQPNGGTMKIRMGITAPLTMTTADTGHLRWPCLIERNFTMAEEFRHSLWIESRQPLDTIGSKLQTESSRLGYALRGELRDDELSGSMHGLRLKRPAEVARVWTTETREGEGQAILQILQATAAPSPARVVVVVDGSRGMDQHYRGIAAALTQLPGGIDFALLLARDGCEELVPLQRGDANLYRRVALEKFRSTGGHDNLPALVRAWDLAASVTNSVVVWVHGPQPMALGEVEELRQRFERSASPPLFFSVQTHSGPNRMLETLDGIKWVRSALRTGDLGDDLGRLFSSWNGQGTVFAWKRELMPAQGISRQSPAQESNLHLARLWAADEIGRLLHSRKTEAALQLAMRYQLVTPVSGAVVLETAAQYEQAGLKPVPPESVPAVPEPSTGLLLLLGAGWWFWRSRSRTAPPFWREV